MLFTEMQPKMPPWIATGLLNTRVTDVAAALVRTKLVLGRVPTLAPWAFRKLAGAATGRMSGVMVTTVEPPVPVKVTEMGEPMAKLSGTKPLPALPREAELKFSAAAAVADVDGVGLGDADVVDVDDDVPVLVLVLDAVEEDDDVDVDEPVDDDVEVEVDVEDMEEVDVWVDVPEDVDV